MRILFLLYSNEFLHLVWRHCVEHPKKLFICQNVISFSRFPYKVKVARIEEDNH